MKYEGDMKKVDIKSMLLTELEDYFMSIGEQKFRAKQVFFWLHEGVCEFADMTNISNGLREKLGEAFYITQPEIVEKQKSEIDGTIKYLWRLNDGETVESVLMEYKHGTTVCISSQVGCRMGCQFCASSIGGLVRNLSASEMLDQVLFAQIDSDKRISNIVLMGMGEPLDNFDSVVKFIRLITHPEGINIGARHITISTCGIIEYIDKLSELDVQLTLAISLHAPDDETRNKIIPTNRTVGVERLIEAGDKFFKTTGRRITYEYAMIDNINDSAQHAHKLASLLSSTKSHLNIILLSNIPNTQFQATSQGTLKKFTNILDKSDVSYTLRRSLGADIEAACGQLRNRAK